VSDKFLEWTVTSYLSLEATDLRLADTFRPPLLQTTLHLSEFISHYIHQDVEDMVYGRKCLPILMPLCPSSYHYSSILTALLTICPRNKSSSKMQMQMLLQAQRKRRSPLRNCESRKVRFRPQHVLSCLRLFLLTHSRRSLRALPPKYDENRLPRPRRYPQLHPDDRAGRGNVQRRTVSLHICHRPRLPSRGAQSQVHPKDLPSQHRSRRQRLSQHSARRLEASFEFTSGDHRSAGMLRRRLRSSSLSTKTTADMTTPVPLPRAQRLRSSEQRSSGRSAIQQRRIQT
jgi:hypothetical protein